MRSIPGNQVAITVKCSDNTTVCDSRSTSIDIVGDIDSLYFDCTKCGSSADLYFDQGDVVVDTVAKTVTVTVHSVGISATFAVNVSRQNAETLSIDEVRTNGWGESCV